MFMRAVSRRPERRVTPLVAVVVSAALLGSGCAEYRPARLNAPARPTTLPQLDIRVVASGLDGLGEIEATGRGQIVSAARSALAGLIGESDHFHLIDTPGWSGVLAPSRAIAARPAASGSTAAATKPKKSKGFFSSFFGSNETEDGERGSTPEGAQAARTGGGAARGTTPGIEFTPYRLRVQVEYLELQAGKQIWRASSVPSDKASSAAHPFSPFDGVDHRYTAVSTRTTIYFEREDPESGRVDVIASSRGKHDWAAPWAFTAKRSAGTNTEVVFLALEESIADGFRRLLRYPKLHEVESEMRRVRAGAALANAEEPAVDRR